MDTTCEITCERPTGVAISVGTTNAVLSWNPEPNALSTQIQYRIVGGGGANTLIAGYGAVSKNFSNLTPGSNYQMRLRHSCDVGFRSPFKYKPFATNAIRAGEMESVSLFPNPVAEMLNVAMVSESEFQTQIIVQDFMGREMMRQKTPVSKGANSLKVDVADLPSGVYFISVEYDAEVFSSKFVVTK